MTSQGHVPQRREGSSRLGGAAAALFGLSDGGDATGATVEDEQRDPTWFEKIERHLRGTRLAWWLRRYGVAYRSLAALRDAEVAQTFGIAWLVYACVAG